MEIIFFTVVISATLGYILGRSDGKVEGRIESFQANR